jgi:hypothetical protein
MFPSICALMHIFVFGLSLHSDGAVNAYLASRRGRVYKVLTLLGRLKSRIMDSNPSSGHGRLPAFLRVVLCYSVYEEILRWADDLQRGPVIAPNP